MILMSALSVESILKNLKARYARDQIYTNVGQAILVAVNPYKNLDIYSQSDRDNYRYSSSPHVPE